MAESLVDESRDRVFAWPMRTAAALGVCLLIFASCGTPEAFDGVKRAPRANIDVFEAGKEPSRPYKVIMTFSEEGGSGDEADRHRDFVRTAKKLGADAIIFKETKTGGWSFNGFGGGTKATFSATAVVYEAETK